MSGWVPLLTGLAVTVIVGLVWLGAIGYLRHLRSTNALAPAAVHPVADVPAVAGTPAGSAPSGPVPAADADGDVAGVEANGDVAGVDADGDAADIDAWLARARALPEVDEPDFAPPVPRSRARIEAVAARYFPHLTVPEHLHLFGLTGAEKRLLAWVSKHTGLPDPFVALDRLTGDPDALCRATDAWHDAHAEVTAVIDGLCRATETLHDRWDGPAADRFFPVLAEYLGELDALAADIATTEQALRGLQAEAELAESTIVGLINLIIGSFGGYVVEAVLSAGTMTPAVAAQAQIELTWVLKQIAKALGRLESIYVNVRHILQSVTGFKGLDHVRQRFRPEELAAIARAIDPVR